MKYQTLFVLPIGTEASFCPSDGWAFDLSSLPFDKAVADMLIKSLRVDFCESYFSFDKYKNEYLEIIFKRDKDNKIERATVKLYKLSKRDFFSKIDFDLGDFGLFIFDPES